MTEAKRDSTYLFVYGTLMRGYGNHELLRESRLLGLGAACGLALYVEALPFVVDGEEEQDYVIGEVYAIRPRVLRSCDKLEGHPHVYRREQKYIRLARGSEVKAWYYRYTRELPSDAKKYRSYRIATSGRSSSEFLAEVQNTEFEALLQ